MRADTANNRARAPVRTAAEVASEVRAGRLSPVDVVKESLDQIAALNPTLNALIEVRGPEARASAQAMEKRIERGEDPGPLAGVPVAIKDVMWEAGVESTDGSAALVGFVPQESTAIVDRLIGAGAIVVGRSNVPEFCYRGITANDLYGTTSNPWDLGRTPGGSSGGAASAVAAGLTAIATGSDGGGSIRIPASFCGVVGLKPTFGLVPREPGWPGWWSLAHLGPIAFTVLDAGLMLAVMAGPDHRDPASLPGLGHDYAAAAREPGDLRGLRIAISEDLGYVTMDGGVRERFREAVARFRDLGAQLEKAHPALESPIDTWNTIATADGLASEGPLLATGRVGEDTRSLIEAGRKVSGADYAHARNEQYRYAQEWSRFMMRYDLVLTPAMECVAFEHGRTGPVEIGGRPVSDFFDDWCYYMLPFNLTGQPAVSVPMGSAEHGMPVGLQIAGRRFADHVVIRAAAAWERIAPWERPPRPTKPHCRAGSDEVNAVAGSRVDSPEGSREVRRAWRPDGDERRIIYA